MARRTKIRDAATAEEFRDAVVERWRRLWRRESSAGQQECSRGRAAAPEGPRGEESREPLGGRPGRCGLVLGEGAVMGARGPAGNLAVRKGVLQDDD